MRNRRFCSVRGSHLSVHATAFPVQVQCGSDRATSAYIPTWDGHSWLDGEEHAFTTLILAVLAVTQLNVIISDVLGDKAHDLP